VFDLKTDEDRQAGYDRDLWQMNVSPRFLSIPEAIPPWRSSLSASHSPGSNSSDRGHPSTTGDRWFWTTLRTLWSRWAEVLLIVKLETVVGWHRTGFRLYWRWRWWPRGGRPRISPERRDWIGRLAKENPDWGAPKIHAELLMAATDGPLWRDQLGPSRQ